MIEAFLIVSGLFFGLLFILYVIAGHTPRKDFQRLADELDDSPLDGDEELGWYDWCDNSTCEICDELILEDEAILVILDQDGNRVTACEYCLNPKL